MPATCPACGSALQRDEEEVVWRCENTSCPARLRRGLEHFASRGGDEHRGAGRVARRSAGRAAARARLRRPLSPRGRRSSRTSSSTPREPRSERARPRKLGKVGRNVVAEIERSKANDLSRLIYAPRHPARRREGGGDARAALPDDGRGCWRRRSRRCRRCPRSGRSSPRRCGRLPTSRAIAQLIERLAAAGVNMASQAPEPADEAGAAGREDVRPDRHAVGR